MSVCLTGLDIEAKAALVEEAFWRACPLSPGDFEQVTTRLMRNDEPDPLTNEQAVAIWRVSVKDPDEKKVGRPFSNAVTELALATIPGFFGVGGGPSAGRPFGVYEPAAVVSDEVPQEVILLDGARTTVSSVIDAADVTVSPALGPEVSVPAGPLRPGALGSIFGARSGDKGGNANLGIFARSDAAWAWLDEHMTEQRLRELLPELGPLRVDRHRLPALRALNFVVHGLLEEGVAASTRQDPQAKSLGEWWRARVVELPESLLDG